MKCLVIGYGSIGKRHAQILTRLNCEVFIQSKRRVPEYSHFSSLEKAFANNSYDYIIVANDTSLHYETALSLIDFGFKGILLIEKPIFHKWIELPQNKFKNIFVGYNLRFHPIIQAIRFMLRNRKIYSIQVYAGQYLPYWRPDRDYRKTYSSDKQKGGGVFKDLSHEIDYLMWLLGDWERITGILGKYSNLEIDSEDVCCLLIATKKCPAIVIQLNYLDRMGRRELVINMENQTIKADLIAGTIEENGELTHFDYEKDQTYRDQHKAIIEGHFDNLCSYREGLNVLHLIENAEIASYNNTWRQR